MTTFIPLLQPSDIQHAIRLITESYAGQVSVEDQRRYQWELFEVQKKYEAWGLVTPLLDHPDPNVQFFGAHTAQVKIVRDWKSFPRQHAVGLKDLLLESTCRAITANRSNVILRKLYVALSQLALKLHPTRPSQWPDWILATVTHLSGHGASPEQLLDFLAIVPEEIRTSDLIGTTKASMSGSLTEAIPLVVQAISSLATSAATTPHQIQTALQCLEKWIVWGLPANDLAPLIPMLVSLLSFEHSFVAASDTLQEILTSSSLADGSGNKILTEPLLDFLSTSGRAIYERSISHGFIDETSHSLCKLLCALGDHSSMHFAATLPARPTQTYLRLMLNYTGLPGWFGVDEEESDMCLPFWYLLQESLWTVDFVSDREPGKESEGWERSEEKQWEVANEVYMELVDILRRKVMWPKQEVLNQWPKDQVDKFAQYRRDIGDILVNAYYVLRDKVLETLVSAVADAISADEPRTGGWESIEATLHCIMCSQEAIPVEENPVLKRLFDITILEKISSSGTDRVRRTMIQLIGEYATWFTTLPAYDRLLMDVVGLVVAALHVPSLCFPAANSLKEMCDANRIALAPHMAAFGDLHSGIAAIPDTEKSKVLQSIASVVQAVPPRDAIQPTEAIVNPVLEKLAQAITLAGQLPEDARNLCIQQLHALTGCARGLTSASEPLFVLEEESEGQPELAEMNAARDDPRVIKLRQDIIVDLERVMQLWSTDSETADALKDLFKAITCLPADVSLISLPPGPLLELVCTAAQRRLNSVWLGLAAMLMGQLCPPSLTTLSLGPTPDAENLVLSALPMLLEPCFVLLHSTQAMEEDPDIALSLFLCMEMVTRQFTRTIYNLPIGIFTTLMQTTVGAMAIQERYALVSACSFLMGLVRQTFADGNLSDQADALMNVHGKAIVHAILSGFAGVAPRSTLPNLIDLLALIALKRTDQCRIWMRETLFSEYFVQSQATPDAKEKFLRIVTSARSTKKIRDASNQFALIARGLEGSSFGYATITF
ncbi:ARM repeat-containing protein [Hysterangium stoloniferum]|nr:ARM repeat-containing protein [Hysterangium stoloniferum]